MLWLVTIFSKVYIHIAIEILELGFVEFMWLSFIVRLEFTRPLRCSHSCPRPLLSRPPCSALLKPTYLFPFVHLAYHSAGWGEVVLPHPFLLNPSLKALRRPFGFEMDIFSISPNCLIVLIIWRNISGVELNCFSTMLLSSSFVLASRSHPTSWCISWILDRYWVSFFRRFDDFFNSQLTSNYHLTCVVLFLSLS